MNRRRVVITGMGAVSPLGTSLPETWKNLLEGRTGVGPITSFDVGSHASQIAAMVKDYDPENWFSRREARHLDRFTQYALVACAEAFTDSGLEMDREDPDRAGVILATGIGGIQEIESQDHTFMAKGARRITPHFIPMMMPNAAAGQIAIKYGLKGINFTVASACASAGHATGVAARMIRWGDADLMVTGGTEAAITPLGLAGFSNMKALSTRNDDPARASRPYDRDRDGFVMGEGAGVLILEELERARARGARIYAELKGFGQNDDAFHITAPDETAEGACRVMRKALQDAGLDPEEVDYINGHGTSTPLNDKVECMAIAKAFGGHASRVALSSTKSMVGHLLGASAAVELAVSALSIHEGRIHLSANLENPDETATMDLVRGSSREQKVRNLVKNSFGFGGHNACLVLGALD